jgi:hypothetical protein
MKTLKSIVVAALIAFSISFKVNAEPVTYSHLPLKLSEYLKDKLRNPDQRIEKSLIGNVYLEFYVDENCQMQVVGLSSSNIELGAFVKNELENMPELTMYCPKGIVYLVKVRLSYQ